MSRRVPSDRISIHTPLAGSDCAPLMIRSKNTYFNPHSPCGERRESEGGSVVDGHISIHTPLAGSDIIHAGAVKLTLISIHTPLAGSDISFKGSSQSACYFNPHSPCGERPKRSNGLSPVLTFQSTLPLRGATSGHWRWSVYGEISIHTPLAGSDPTRLTSRSCS